MTAEERHDGCSGTTRPVRPEDRPDIAILASHTYGGHDWILDEIDSWMANPLCITLGIELNGKLVALENLRMVDEGATGCCEALRVHPDVRRRGFAARLQRRLMEAARERWSTIERFRYTTALSMVPSLRLAESCGMVEAHRWGFELVSPAGEPRSLIKRGDPKGLLQALRTELARVRTEEEEDGTSLPSRIETCESAGSAAELAKRICPTAGLICDWKVEIPRENALEGLYAAGARLAYLRTVGEREALTIGKTRPDFSGSVRVFTVEACGGGTVAERYRDFLVLAIHECEASVEDGTRACLVHNGKECVLLEGREGAS